MLLMGWLIYRLVQEESENNNNKNMTLVSWSVQRRKRDSCLLITEILRDFGTLVTMTTINTITITLTTVNGSFIRSFVGSLARSFRFRNMVNIINFGNIVLLFQYNLTNSFVYITTGPPFVTDVLFLFNIE